MLGQKHRREFDFSIHSCIPQFLQQPITVKNSIPTKRRIVVGNLLIVHFPRHTFLPTNAIRSKKSLSFSFLPRTNHSHKILDFSTLFLFAGSSSSSWLLAVLCTNRRQNLQVLKLSNKNKTPIEMVPVTPSPRRRVGYLGNRNRSSSVSSTSVLASPPRRSTSGARTPTRLGLSPPPLYHHQNGITTNESSLSPSPTTTMMVLSDKRGNRVGLSSRSAHTFRPVVVPRDEQQASSMMMTPPTSPFQRYSHVVTCSPSPSLVSTATTPTAATTAETWSDATMTPRSSLSSSASSFCSVSPSPTYFPFYRPPGTNHRDDTRSPRKSSGSYNASSKRRSSSSTTSSPSSVATAYSTSTNRESDETSRKQRVKTEMCMHYSSGKPCPFGANCTYAHGEEELQMTKLVDLHRAGLIDMDTYRTNPCLTWVTTGSW